MTAPTRRSRASTPRPGLLAVTAALVVLLAGCSALLEAAPTPTPQPFPGITGELGRVGVIVTSWTSGDAGCDDPTLSPTAIRFDAQGLDQRTPVHVRIYIFKNREAFDRRSPDVESCVATWATDPATFELLQVSPYVVAGQGPWPPAFDQAMREGITAAAGTGD
ncbi:MAG TPA: hypothetical protein VFP56_06655 [Candidatus Limnocylindrales bacterium]|nr:hypothetical protein [Candidatus Limnocylindrales bacterium]